MKNNFRFANIPTIRPTTKETQPVPHDDAVGIGQPAASSAALPELLHERRVAEHLEKDGEGGDHGRLV